MEKPGMLPSEVQTMQNHPEKKSGAFQKFVKEKGYYIVLAICVAAVGVSGYLFVKTAADQTRSELESSSSHAAPLTPSGVEPEPAEPGKKPSVSVDPETAEDAVSDFSDDAAEAVAPDESGTESVSAAVTTVRPLSGETQAAYSMDALAYNETTRDWRTHNGIDIAAEAGAQVTAARAGTVSAIYDDNAFGKTVVVNHDNGYATHYANLSESVAVTVGQAVDAGDVIGTVGDTATVEVAQGSHLHFAVYQNKEPMDPEAFLNS